MTPDFLQQIPALKEEQAALLHQAGSIFSLAQSVIDKTYLASAEHMPVATLDDFHFDRLGQPDRVHLLELTRVVYDKRENSLENLLNVYSALGQNYGFGLLVRSEKNTTRLFLVIRAYSQTYTASSGKKILERAIEGHFPGTALRALKEDEPQALLGFRSKCVKETDESLQGLYEMTRNSNWGISATVAVPGLKAEDRDAFTQGVEKFIDAMEGKEYAALIFAEPMSRESIASIQSGYEQLASSLSGYGKVQLSFSQNDSEAVGESMARSFSMSTMESLSQTQTQSTSSTRTTSTSETKTTGSNFAPGVGIGSAIGLLLAGGNPMGAWIGGSIGGGAPSYSTSESKTETNANAESQGQANSQSTTHGTNIQVGDTKTGSKTKTVSTGHNLVVDFRNVAVERLSEKIEGHLERLDEIRAYGAWTAGAFFIAPDAEIADTAASIYMGTLRGECSDLGNATIVKWDNKDKDKRDLVLQNLTELRIPRLRMNSDEETHPIWVTPATLVSSKELALMLNLPRRSIGGVTVLDGVGFGRDARLLSDTENKDSERQIPLGYVRHLYRDRPNIIKICSNDFTKHVLVTGTTGTGKTTTIKHILKQLRGQGIPFLVLEPAKDEYSDLVHIQDTSRPVHIYQVGKADDTCLKLNPLVFPWGGSITLMEHIDRVCALFNAAFPMYAAMPQILEEAVVRSYERCGWDLMTSRFVGSSSSSRFPTLRDVAGEIEDIVTSAGYDGESKSTYIGALKTRINSLMRGSLGMTFGANHDEETSPVKLFDKPCVVNLSALGSPEKKSIVMGMLLIRLQEYRISKGMPQDDDLHHLLVVEEAHNLLKNTGDSANLEMANPRGQAIEYFSNLIAEMRAYGQGFLIADQSVSVLDPAIQRNTNTKMAFCAPFEADREILAGSLALDDEQKKALARLESHTAIVKQNNWADAIQCHIDTHIVGHSLLRAEEGTLDEESPHARQADAVCDDALCLLLSRIGKSQKPTRSLNVVADWLDRLPQGGDLVAGIWRKLCADAEFVPSDAEAGQALYAFPRLTSAIQQAFQSTETPEGMRTRLIIETEWIHPMLNDAQIDLGRFLTLLLTPCKSDVKVNNVLNSFK